MTKQQHNQRWWHHFFPPMPDFHASLNRQCHLAVKTAAALLAYMRTDLEDYAAEVLTLADEAEQVRAANMTQLHQAFATPFDREDIYRSINAIHAVTHYARTTIRELQALQLHADAHCEAIAALLFEAAWALEQGYGQLATQPLQAERSAEQVRATEEQIESIYRTALAELFSAEHYQANLTAEQQEAATAVEVLLPANNPAQQAAIGTAAGFVIDILKRREVYRHLSNAADRVVRAGEVLDDIVAKLA